MSKIKAMLKRLVSKKSGQGVIEYAGAMIVAALIVAAVLVIGQDGMGNVYNSIFSGVEDFFQGKADSLNAEE
jgi:Flp pilus assembly pilin Flp